MRLPDVLESSALLQGSSTWRRGLEKPLLIISDIIALLVAGIAWRPDLAREMHGLDLEFLLSPQALSDRQFIFLLVVLLAMGMFWLRGHYSRRVPFWHETRQVIKYCFFLALLDVTALFFANLAPSRGNLLFAWLSTRGHDVPGLILVISADNLSAGIASAAFVAYLSGLTNVAYSATQYALFSSIMLLLPKFTAGWSGLAVDTYGYEAFFIGTACLGLPVVVLVWLAARQQMAPAKGNAS